LLASEVLSTFPSQTVVLSTVRLTVEFEAWLVVILWLQVLPLTVKFTVELLTSGNSVLFAFLAISWISLAELVKFAINIIILLI